MKNIHVFFVFVVVIVVTIVGTVVVLNGGKKGDNARRHTAKAPVPAKKVQISEISRHASDLPSSITRTENELVVIELDAKELTAEMMPGVTYDYWTYNGQVPGPFIRVKQGDDVEIRLSHGADAEHHHATLDLHLAYNNPGSSVAFPGISTAYAAEDPVHDDSHSHSDEIDTGVEKTAEQHAAEGHASHSIDLHAVTGPGGGAKVMQVSYGETKAFRFNATHPGIYVYHCASAHVPTHIANGMYGMILVEPKEGLAKADKEFYVMQGDFYTDGEFGVSGHQAFSKEHLLNEDPNYFVFNGRVGALTGERAMKAKVGETVRLYVGVGSHIASNFHVIGEIFDRLYKDGAITDPPLRNVQTTIIPAGGATMVEFKVEYPGTYLLVDHSLTRAFDKGALAELVVEGEADPAVSSSVD